MTEVAGDTWGSTTDAAGVVKWLREKRNVVVTTHTKPDGDAVGSSVALARALNIAAGGSPGGFSGVASRAEVWFHGPPPPWLGAVAGDVKRRQIDNEYGIPATADPDAVVIVDTGAWSQLRPLEEWLSDRTGSCLVIDHHLRGDADVGATRLVETKAAAACQIVAPLCASLLGKTSITDLPVEVATPLYLGLATDTGWFRHANVTPAAMRTAADLLETGVDHEALHAMIEQRDKPSRLALLQRALASLEYHAEGAVAMMKLRQADFAETGASPGDSGGFLDVVRTVEVIRVAALLTEATVGSNEGPLTKVSFRSKGGPGMVDVNQVASSLGGGGHAQAAGARIDAPLDDAWATIRERLVSAIDEQG
ncbi:MAG: hypothetical protein CMJ31_13525 [Phycisphaerae bacterium]|nr:hypothetical protein [Phycisphaerae bacterium]